MCFNTFNEKIHSSFSKKKVTVVVICVCNESEKRKEREKISSSFLLLGFCEAVADWMLGRQRKDPCFTVNTGFTTTRDTRSVHPSVVFLGISLKLWTMMILVLRCGCR